MVDFILLIERIEGFFQEYPLLKRIFMFTEKTEALNGAF